MNMKFEITWEQRKFSDFTFPAGERNKDDLDLEPFAITNNQGFIAQSEAHDDFGYMKDVDRKMYIVVKPNSFAYNPARINVGSLGYYEGEENVIVSSLYEVFQTAEYVDDKFLKHWFKTKAFQDWIERLQEGSVRLYFYYDKLCECIMSMPSVEEQRKIGAYLDKIDNLITLHQREYFSFGFGSRSAKIAQNTLSWEQRKLGECAEFNPKSELPNIFEYVDLESVVGTDILSHRTESKSSAPSRAQRLARKGDVFYQTVRPYQKNNCIFENDETNWVFSTGYAQLRPVNDGYFLLTLLQNEDFVKLVLDRCTGTSYPAINSNDLADIDVNIPIDNLEQHKIGDYFRKLDTLITLHQRELNWKRT